MGPESLTDIADRFERETSKSLKHADYPEIAAAILSMGYRIAAAIESASRVSS